MMQFIMPIILIGISVAVFFVYSNPIYNDMGGLRTQIESYDKALSNSKVLKNEIDKLTTKFNSIDKDDLEKIQKLLPENIDNIRLILEIEDIAKPYGMALKNIKYNPTSKDVPTAEGEIQRNEEDLAAPKDYGIWDLEFSTSGTYNNFLNFTRDLQGNLRIVDISSIQFASDTTTATTSGSSGSGGASVSPSPESYDYSFKIKTYWLKN